MGKTEYAKPGKIFIAFTTVVPTSSSTGFTLTEPSWTGYARPELPAASIAAAVEGPTNPKTTNKVAHRNRAASDRLTGYSVQPQL
jgi:hypothetical protein